MTLMLHEHGVWAAVCVPSMPQVKATCKHHRSTLATKHKHRLALHLGCNACLWWACDRTTCRRFVHSSTSTLRHGVKRHKQPQALGPVAMLMQIAQRMANLSAAYARTPPALA